MIGRKFGTDIENLVKEKSSNHIVLKSRSFSFDGKAKPPAHITRKSYLPDSKPPHIPLNKTVTNRAFINKIENNKQNNMPKIIQKDEQIVPYFLKDCLTHMKAKQCDKKISVQTLKCKNPQYMRKRAQIVDWIVGFHYDLKLLPQTLYIAVSYMDNFYAKSTAIQQEFFLVAAVCILIAAKFEETSLIPGARFIQQPCEYHFSRERIIKMQEKIIQSLDFQLIVETPLKYLQLFSQISNLSKKEFCLAHYGMELSLIELNFLEYSPSILASSSIYLINKIRKSPSCWPTELKELMSYEESDLRNCAKQLCILLEKAPHMQNVRNIRQKFSKQEFCSISTIRLTYNSQSNTNQ